MTKEQTKAVVVVIRTLGFVGGAHYCPSCMNEFHADRGQHESGCSYLADSLKDDDDDDWWDELVARLA